MTLQQARDLDRAWRAGFYAGWLKSVTGSHKPQVLLLSWVSRGHRREKKRLAFQAGLRDPRIPFGVEDQGDFLKVWGG